VEIHENSYEYLSFDKLMNVLQEIVLRIETSYSELEKYEAIKNTAVKKLDGDKVAVYILKINQTNDFISNLKIEYNIILDALYYQQNLRRNKIMKIGDKVKMTSVRCKPVGTIVEIYTEETFVNGEKIVKTFYGVSKKSDYILSEDDLELINDMGIPIK